jgi:transposase
MQMIHFLGVDVSQDWFDVAIFGSAKPAQFSNNAEGFAAFARHCVDLDWSKCFVVVEATGGYETRLLRFLITQGVHVHRATPLHAKHFIKSLGHKAKTDKIDALALARYAVERHAELPVFVFPDEEQSAFNDLMMRRNDLVAFAAAEKVRASQPRYKDAASSVMQSVEAMLGFITAQIAEIEAELDALVDASPSLSRRIETLRSIKGVGRLSAYTLQAFMPELGTLTRRTAASLAGCAPHPRDSGIKNRKRSVFGGRGTVKRILFLAAMAARRYEPTLKAFFEKLVANGKPKMVALTALMRKIIVIANARLKQNNLQSTW